MYKVENTDPNKLQRVISKINRKFGLRGTIIL
jgi:hypothetical protein